VEVLSEIIENVGWYIEYGGPLLVIIVPLIIWFVRQRIYQGRINTY
jgi:hypothetical protein